jgi:hypothetical protein
MLRRSAAMGAALAVAGPVVQGLGQLGAFAQVSPPPPVDDQPNVPSHIQLIVSFGDNPARYGVKWDQQWEGLRQQGNVCWSEGDPVYPFERASADQLAYFSTATVTATPRGYEVSLPEAITVVDAAATFDGSACYFAGTAEGPYWDGPLLIFPKPTTR